MVLIGRLIPVESSKAKLPFSTVNVWPIIGACNASAVNAITMIRDKESISVNNRCGELICTKNTPAR